MVTIRNKRYVFLYTHQRAFPDVASLHLLHQMSMEEVKTAAAATVRLTAPAQVTLASTNAIGEVVESSML